MSVRRITIVVGALLIAGSSIAQENINTNKFRQLKQELATPNVYRTAAGAPGHEYYQQQADYDIKVQLNDGEQKLTGEETITYYNNSPDPLEYLWVQLDQNVRAKDSDSKKVQTNSVTDGKMSFKDLKKLHNDFDGGFKLEHVKDASGNPMNYTINKTMMRIDLPKPLASKESVSFSIKWWYNINNRMEIGGRSGYEYFPKDKNYLYTIAQFYPRMAVYNEVEGWQNKQFLGRGEFTLPFGDFKVSITVPSDHVVGATGLLQNANEVLTQKQKDRFKEAATATKPVMIITESEATKNEKSRQKALKTWVYHAKNVRDFAFASSRKFIWDAMSVQLAEKKVMAMSYYPKEGNPLWERYSTKAVAQTLITYSKHTFDYPYPVAISVHAKSIGMEYPMICFNGGRPETDGTYSKRTKYAMIGVIIHEVGHNYFPMIINSDERQWTWMDEGLNTFLQYLTERQWERDYPSRRGPAAKIVDYMKGDKNNISPIMTNSESIHQFGNNAYGKPATAMNILRETIMGRELFDYAFKMYANRWKFKHPTPADLFRTMEDASGVDLDWFWRGWFYTTDHVDISMDQVVWLKVDTKNPSVEKPIARKEDANKDEFIGDTRNKESIKQTRDEADTDIPDFYTKYDPFAITSLDKEEYDEYMEKLKPEEKALLTKDYNYYEIKFSNIGGLVMPIILEFEFKDGKTEVLRIPAEIWKTNNEEVSKIFFFKKEVSGIRLDPFLETADTDLNNNFWPHQQQPTRFELFKDKSTRFGGGEKNNLMRKHQKGK
jgi:hypothetical protein